MLRPDAASNAEVDKNLPRWRSEFGLRGRAMAPERRHVSLLWVGRTDRLPDGHVDRVCRKTAGLFASPFEVRFDRIARFGGDSIVLLGSHGNPLTFNLREILRDVLKHDVPPPKKDFTPHLTVLYDDDAPRCEHPIDPIGWMATEFFLIESFQGEGRHAERGRWDLHEGCRQAPDPDDGMPSGIMREVDGCRSSIRRSVDRKSLFREQNEDLEGM